MNEMQRVVKLQHTKKNLFTNSEYTECLGLAVCKLNKVHNSSLFDYSQNIMVMNVLAFWPWKSCCLLAGQFSLSAKSLSRQIKVLVSRLGLVHYTWLYKNSLSIYNKPSKADDA